MNHNKYISGLWDELREAINTTYAQSQEVNVNQDERNCLCDYAENISWHDALAGLLGREAANERQHRRNRPSPRGFGVGAAAKLILMENVVEGAKAEQMPKATCFLVFRQTAMEARTIGWLIRANLSNAWMEAVKTQDYAELMQAA
jgi:hypothetical protein